MSGASVVFIKQKASSENNQDIKRNPNNRIYKGSKLLSNIISKTAARTLK